MDPLTCSTDGYARVPEDGSKSSTEAWPTNCLFFSFRSPPSQHASFVHLMPFADPSAQYPQTTWRQLQSVRDTQSASQPLRPSPLALAQVLQQHNGRSASEFWQDGRAWDPDHARIMTVHYSKTQRTYPHGNFALEKIGRWFTTPSCSTTWNHCQVYTQSCESIVVLHL